MTQRLIHRTTRYKKGKYPVTWRNIGWGLLFIFFGTGYLLLRSRYENLFLEFAILTVISLFTSGVFLLRYRTVNVLNLPVWILFAVFLIGYYFKLYWMVMGATTLDPTGTPFWGQRLTLAAVPSVVLFAYQATTTGFAVFVVSSILALPRDRLHTNLTEKHFACYKPQPFFLAVLPATMGIVLLIGTTVIAVATGLLNAGDLGTRTTFRLAGWLAYIRQAVLPVLFLTVVHFGFVKRSRFWTIFGITLVLSLFISEAFIRTTRSSLFFAVLMIAFMYYVSHHRIRRTLWVWFASLVSLGFLMFPILSQYRTLRSYGSSSASLSVLLDAVALQSTIGFGAVFQDGMTRVVARIIGSDSLLFLTHRSVWADPNLVDTIFGDYGSVANYLTRVLIGIPDGIPHADAPSLLGWFYILGDWWGLILGFGIFVFVGLRVWRALVLSNLLVKPVAQTVFLVQWLSLASEGTIDSSRIQIAAYLLTLTAMEGLWRWGIGKNLAKGLTQLSIPLVDMHRLGTHTRSFDRRAGGAR